MQLQRCESLLQSYAEVLVAVLLVALSTLGGSAYLVTGLGWKHMAHPPSLVVFFWLPWGALRGVRAIPPPFTCRT